jgi:hypothetical protein
MAHPVRRSVAETLIARLGGTPDLVLDPAPTAPPSALRTALAAWRAIGEGASHHLVLQDDAQPAPGFLDCAAAAAEARPDAVLCFYAHWASRNAAMTRMAARHGRAWGELVPTEYVPTVAALMPAEVVAGFLAFAGERDEGPDDELLSEFLRASGAEAYVAAPNLVEHADLPSLVGNEDQGRRRSACFVGSCVPHRDASGVLRLAETAGLSQYWGGEPLCVATESWGLMPWCDMARRLGIDEPRLWSGFAAAQERLPASVRELLAAGNGRPISSLWITAYLEGALAGAAASSNPAVLRDATERMVAGGLSRLPLELSQPGLAALADFAELAIAAGSAPTPSAVA